MKLSKNMQKFLKNSQNRKNFATFVRTVLNNPYIPHMPTTKQAGFLIDNSTPEGFYGGAAGGGKSDALLMAGLQFVEIPTYSALIFRRTYADLSLPGALMDRADEWLHNTDARWREKSKTWEFPSGATLTFGYLEHEKDKYRYQSAEFQYVAFDELTQFTETQYQYLFSRTRRLADVNIPIRILSASNPGGVGHDWVKARFISPPKEVLIEHGRFFVSARLEDNPYLDQVEYGKALDRLDPVTREQLRFGDWDVSLSGGMFKRSWFEYERQIPDGQQVRYWDLAATKPVAGSDPDYTVGCLMLENEGKFYIKDIIRMRDVPGEVEAMVKRTALEDGIETKIVMEQEPGSSGVNTIDHYARRVLRGFNFIGEKVTGSKIVRAQPMSAAASQGNIMLEADKFWAANLLHELERFPSEHVKVHDDQVDAMSGAFNVLAGHVGLAHGHITRPKRKKSEIPGISFTKPRRGILTKRPGL